MASQPDLASATARNDRLGLVLSSNAALVSAIAACPGLGPAIARQPLLAAAVIAEDGWLAGSLASSPALAAAVATDSQLALAIATGGVPAPGASGPLPNSPAVADAASVALGLGWSAGGLLAERLAREPGLIAALGPSLTKIMAGCTQVGLIMV